MADAIGFVCFLGFVGSTFYLVFLAGRLYEALDRVDRARKEREGGS